MPVVMAPLLELPLPGPTGNRLMTSMNATNTPTQDTAEAGILRNSDLRVSRGNASTATSPIKRRKENPLASMAAHRTASTAHTIQNSEDLPDGLPPAAGVGV
jgi:hypothetical protein